MVARLARDNSTALTASGHGATAGNIYLAHFLGVGAAVGVLNAAPDTPVRDALRARRTNAPSSTAPPATGRLSDIAAVFGAEVERSSIRVLPLAGMTAEAFKAGRPVPYMLAWEDSDGLIRTLSPGQAFMVDGAAVRERASLAREEDFMRANERPPADPHGGSYMLERTGRPQNVNRGAKGDRLSGGGQ